MPRPSTKTTSKKSSKTHRQNSYTKFTQQPDQYPNVFLLLFVGIIGLGLCLLLGLKMAKIHLFQDAKHQLQLAQSTTIKGTLLFTALKPDPQDKGEVLLSVKEVGQTGWVDTGITIPLRQDAPWQWDNALPGMNYELQAILKIDGKEIAKSEVVHTTAPAEQVELPLEVNWRNLPEDVVKGSTTKLAGDVVINGYIPATSVMEVYTLPAKYYEKEFYQITPEILQTATKIASVSPVTSSVHWNWDQAIPLEQYMVVTVLKDKNKIIGTAEEMISADAGEEKLEQTINSQALPTPAAKTAVLGSTTDMVQTLAQAASGVELTSISGTAYLQGPKQANTSLLMLWRKPGEQDFKVINRYMYPPSSGTPWQWTEAQVGQTYEISAALQVNQNNTSTLQVPLRVTAPATKVNLTLNTWYVIPRTNQNPVNEVCVDNNGQQSTAILRLPQMANGAQYWVQVGGDHGQTNLYNQKVPATGQDVKVRVRVQNGHTNYMKYSYATCVHCSDDSNFAPFSDEVGFTCS